MEAVWTTTIRKADSVELDLWRISQAIARKSRDLPEVSRPLKGMNYKKSADSAQKPVAFRMSLGAILGDRTHSDAIGRLVGRQDRTNDWCEGQDFQDYSKPGRIASQLIASWSVMRSGKFTPLNLCGGWTEKQYSVCSRNTSRALLQSHLLALAQSCHGTSSPSIGVEILTLPFLSKIYPSRLATVPREQIPPRHLMQLLHHGEKKTLLNASRWMQEVREDALQCMAWRSPELHVLPLLNETQKSGAFTIVHIDTNHCCHNQMASMVPTAMQRLH